MKPTVSYRPPKKRCGVRLSSHRLGFVLICLSMLWGLYLIQIQLSDGRSQSEYLKDRIIALSKEYIDALAREKGMSTIEEDTGELREMKKATAVLLQSMLSRLQHLENQVESVIVNSTSEFQHLSKAIKYLNSTIRYMNRSQEVAFCSIPDNPGYPECKSKVEWLKQNWKTEPKFAANGVNGSLCSILFYLSKVENFCPPSHISDDCNIPNDNEYPECPKKISWMKEHWRSDPCYERDHGVDGTLCSFIVYLSELAFSLHTSGPEVSAMQLISAGSVVRSLFSTKTSGVFISGGVLYSSCRDELVFEILTDPHTGPFIYACVERWCPLLPGRVLPKKEVPKPNQYQKPDLTRIHAGGLFNRLTDKNPLKFQWMKRRIEGMWLHWQQAFSSLRSKRDLTASVQKKILIFIGVLASEEHYHFAAEAGKGGPLGELVQWSDVITSLYILGHDLTVTVDVDAVKSALGNVELSAKRPCPQHLPDDIDLLYIDYIGLRLLSSKIGSSLTQIMCRLRVVDSFGTEAQFNYANSGVKVDGGSMGLFGRHNLNLRQFQTMFPHSPDNTFLGFVVNISPTTYITKKPRRKTRALIYGKHISMWKDLPNRAFLELVNKYFEIHVTVGGAPEAELSRTLPPFVKNHGIVPQGEVQKLLNESMVFIGLGFPYEGPAPLEAIASGCFFINPKFNPPRNRLNTKFFIDKPTLRLVTSQHPYCEEFIGPPHVFTIDINNLSEVENVMKKIMISEVSPYLPFEYTHEGMLERVNALIQNQDFCGENKWPPKEALITVKGGKGKSCKETCLVKGMVCEPEFFKLINSPSTLTQNGFPCDSSPQNSASSLVAPGFRKEPRACILQSQPLMFSCTGTSPSVARLCPCRKYKTGQVALCEQC